MKNYLLLFLPIFLIMMSCGGNKAPQSTEGNVLDPIANYSLNDIWVLTSIDGKDIEFETEAPNIEFHLADNVIYGYAGCNRYNSPVEVTDKTVSVGLVVSTKMACADLAVESKFLAAISDKKLTYKIDGLVLTLSNDSEKLTFKKVD